MTNKKVEDDIILDAEAEVTEETTTEATEDQVKASENAADEAVEDTQEEAAEEQNEETTTGDALKNTIKELETTKATNLRMQAEFQNFKKRVEKEKADIYKFANEKLVIELLGVMDNVDRAIGSMDTSESNKNVVDGVQMIHNTLEDFLKKHQVQVIEAVGTPFDPQKHHAVMTEANEDHPSETVIEEFQRGYELNGKVIRPAMVKVSE